MTEGQTELFEGKDRGMIERMGLIMAGILVLFFLFVWWLGLLDFPRDRLATQVKGGHYDYFAQALEYRERRVALALTYRTFLTSFGLIVGLTMAVMGGLFILRRATADFAASARVAPGSMAEKVQSANAFLKTNSPGIVFMLGGVVVIAITQAVSIPISVPDVFPREARLACSRQMEERGFCSTGADRAAVVQPDAAAQAADPARLWARAATLCDAPGEDAGRLQEVCAARDELEGRRGAAAAFAREVAGLCRGAPPAPGSQGADLCRLAGGTP